PAGWTVLFYLGALVLAAVGGWGRETGPLGAAPVGNARRRGALLFALAAAWFAIGAGWGMSPWAQPEEAKGPKLTLTFLSVGHGTSVLIEFPGGETWLYDAGNRGDGHDAARIVWEALQASRKTRI